MSNSRALCRSAWPACVRRCHACPYLPTPSGGYRPPKVLTYLAERPGFTSGVLCSCPVRTDGDQRGSERGTARQLYGSRLARGSVRLCTSALSPPHRPEVPPV